MRNRNLLLLLFAILVLLLIYLLRGCWPGEETEVAPPAGDPVIAPIAIAFLDGASATTVNVKNVNITLTDSRGQVRTCNGDSIVAFTLDVGVMCLGIKKGVNLSPETPYSFTIRAEAADYSTTLQTIVVTNEKPMYIPIYMASIKTPPPGVAVRTQQFNVLDAKLGQGLMDTLKIPGVGQLQINIPEGTQLLRNGIPVEGSNGRMQVTFGDPLSMGAARVFPNGPLVTNAVDPNGTAIASDTSPFFFQSLGWLTVDMEVDGEKVNGFSQEVEFTLPINPELLNPETGGPYSSGMQVPVWSLDENTGAWRQEYKTTLESQGEFNPLRARIRSKHLSTWNLDFFTAPCTGNLNFTIVNSGCAGNLTSEITLSTGGFLKTNVLTYNAGANLIDLIRVPNTALTGGTVQFRVYDTDTPSPGGAPVLGTIGLSNCTPAPTSLSILPASTGAATGCNLFSLEVSLETTTSTVPLCHNALWYKVDTGGSDDLSIATWDFAGHFDGNGVVRMTQLDPTTDYRFMVWWGASPSSNSIRWSIEAGLRTSTGCGATPFDPRLSSTFTGLTRQIRQRCYNDGTTTCTDSGTGSYDCAISGTNFNSARGVFLRILNFPGSATLPPCI
ncbi:MAG: hypothetical protein KDC66_22440 [Phaeodactylibacter sp.]|nr:hypothetical protein [Phaeodactylibacter sp.]MCB9276824.1 hypothetical protein [Lewinellaceae bacterium]